MTAALEHARLAIEEFPWPLWRFLRWQAQQPRAAGAAITSVFVPQHRQKMRFAITPTDVVRVVEAVALSDEQGLLVATSAAGRVELPGLTAQQASDVLGRIDGTTSPRQLAGTLDRSVLRALVLAGAGRMLVAPEAIAALERRISGAEISRLAGSPYTVDRTYWANMAAVREQLSALDGVIDSTDAVLDLLRDLHITTTMGADLCSYYKPQSWISDDNIQPGSFYEPSVSVPLAVCDLGLFQTIARSVDEGLPTDRASYADADGLVWMTSAASPSNDSILFSAVRPWREQHLEKLVAALRTAWRAEDPKDVVGGLATFHQRFIRLHPFACANQSIAMNIVNHVLRRTHGVFVPHLFLDFCAFFLSERAYTTVFARALATYGGPVGVDPYAVCTALNARLDAAVLPGATDLPAVLAA